MFTLALFLGRLIKLIQKVSNPEATVMDEMSEGISVFCALDTMKKKLMTIITEEEFCVLLCAHQKNVGEYTSINRIYKLLCSSACPYDKLYQAAYGHSCVCIDPNGKCSKSPDDIKRILDNLDPRLDVIKHESGLYKIT